jgi:hypothetical protein
MRIQSYVAFQRLPPRPLAYAALGSASVVPRRLRRRHCKRLLPGHRLDGWTPPSYDTYRLETFPDATVAITHRDPVSVVASAITMLTFDRRPWRLEHASTDSAVVLRTAACVSDTANADESFFWR